MKWRLVCLVVGAALVGCNHPQARLNAPPHGYPYETTPTQGTFTYMVDNAMLANMTVADIHFRPHRGMLNSLGEERMARYASLMEAYGGTLRYNTDIEDQELLDKRMATLVEFLDKAGIDTTQEVVVRDMPGGEGMHAAEAVLIRVNEGTYKPEKSTGTGVAATPPSPMSPTQP